MKMLAKILYPVLALGMTSILAVAFFDNYSKFETMTLSRLLYLASTAIAILVPIVVLVCRSLQVWFPRKALLSRWKSLAGTAMVMAISLTPATTYGGWTIMNALLRSPSTQDYALSDEWIEYPELPIVQTLTPFQWSFQDLEGNVRSMAEFQGKVLFLNMWATWCGPCKAEMPGLQAIYEEFREEDRIQFAMVSTEEPEIVRQFADGQEYSFPIFAAKKNERPPFFKGRSLPFTVIFTPDGEIAYQQQGAVKWDTDKTRAFLRALIEFPPEQIDVAASK